MHIAIIELTALKNGEVINVALLKVLERYGFLELHILKCNEISDAAIVQALSARPNIKILKIEAVVRNKLQTLAGIRQQYSQQHLMFLYISNTGIDLENIPLNYFQLLACQDAQALRWKTKEEYKRDIDSMRFVLPKPNFPTTRLPRANSEDYIKYTAFLKQLLEFAPKKTWWQLSGNDTLQTFFRDITALKEYISNPQSSQVSRLLVLSTAFVETIPHYFSLSQGKLPHAMLAEHQKLQTELPALQIKIHNCLYDFPYSAIRENLLTDQPPQTAVFIEVSHVLMLTQEQRTQPNWELIHALNTRLGLNKICLFISEYDIETVLARSQPTIKSLIIKLQQHTSYYKIEIVEVFTQYDQLHMGQYSDTYYEHNIAPVEAAVEAAIIRGVPVPVNSIKQKFIHNIDYEKKLKQRLAQLQSPSTLSGSAAILPHFLYKYPRTKWQILYIGFTQHAILCEQAAQQYRIPFAKFNPLSGQSITKGDVPQVAIDHPKPSSQCVQEISATIAGFAPPTMPPLFFRSKPADKMVAPPQTALAGASLVKQVLVPSKRPGVTPKPRYAKMDNSQSAIYLTGPFQGISHFQVEALFNQLALVYLGPQLCPAKAQLAYHEHVPTALLTRPIPDFCSIRDWAGRRPEQRPPIHNFEAIHQGFIEICVWRYFMGDLDLNDGNIGVSTLPDGTVHAATLDFAMLLPSITAYYAAGNPSLGKYRFSNFNFKGESVLPQSDFQLPISTEDIDNFLTQSSASYQHVAAKSATLTKGIPYNFPTTVDMMATGWNILFNFPSMSGHKTFSEYLNSLDGRRCKYEVCHRYAALNPLRLQSMIQSFFPGNSYACGAILWALQRRHTIFYTALGNSEGYINYLHTTGIAAQADTAIDTYNASMHKRAGLQVSDLLTTPLPSPKITLTPLVLRKLCELDRKFRDQLDLGAPTPDQSFVDVKQNAIISNIIFPNYMCDFSVAQEGLSVYLEPSAQIPTKSLIEQFIIDDMRRAIKYKPPYPILFNEQDVFATLSPLSTLDETGPKFGTELFSLMNTSLSPSFLLTLTANNYNQNLFEADPVKQLLFVEGFELERSVWKQKTLLMQNQVGELVTNRFLLHFCNTGQGQDNVITATLRQGISGLAASLCKLQLDRRKTASACIEIPMVIISQELVNRQVGGSRRWYIGNIEIAGEGLEFVALFLIFRISRALLLYPEMNTMHGAYWINKGQRAHPFDTLLPEELRFLVAQYPYPRILWLIAKEFCDQCYTRDGSHDDKDYFFTNFITLFLAFLQDCSNRDPNFVLTKDCDYVKQGRVNIEQFLV